MLLEMLSAMLAGLFAGAAVYINLVEHPARIECGPTLAVTEFALSYRRAAVMQGALAAIGFLTATSSLAHGFLFRLADRRHYPGSSYPFHPQCYFPHEQTATGFISGQEFPTCVEPSSAMGKVTCRASNQLR